MHKNTIRKIEKIAYETGINVVLYHVERSDWYKDFIKETKQAILTQIKEVATEENIDRLILFAKAEKPDLITEIKTIMMELAQLLGIVDFLIKAGEAGGQGIYDKLGIEGDFVMTNPELISYFEDHSRLLIDSVDDTTKKWLAGKIQDGVDNALNPSEIVDSILEESDVFTDVRAETIVLTETANAVMVVELNTATELGIKEIIWRTSVDDRVCPICLPLEGARTSIGKAFPDGYFHPPAHPRCRCFVEEVIPKEWLPPSQ